jgi:hypothetical protein
MKSKRLILLGTVFLIPLVFIFSQCFNSEPSGKDPRGVMYAGSESCKQCHADIYNNYLHTAHFQSVRLANEKSIQGSFIKGQNSFIFNYSARVEMQKRGNNFYQVSYLNNKQVQAERFAMVFGGVKAQTYLYWKGNQLYELPMSYFNNLHAWTNSPGYDTTRADFTRMIGKRCFECHGSYMQTLPQQTQSLQIVEAYNKNAMILQIDCERCHGPATNHVNYHLSYPGQTQGKYITTYKSLSRAQKIDMCAVCHSGNTHTMYKSTFNFKPGDTLAKYQEPSFMHEAINPATLDVHGNQTQMLQSSPCYIKSNMDCATCHNTHTTERGNLALYSQRCMQCHSTANHNFCKLAPKLGNSIIKNCIDCHMPVKPSTAIAVQSAGRNHAVPYLVRNHRISVYPNEIKRTMAYLKEATTN